jgi:hypothetical protein
MKSAEDNSNPFADWSSLINKSVYSIDGTRLGLLRKISSDYMIVSGGLITLSRYFIPKLVAESVSKSGIKLRITSYEARTQYSYARMRNFIWVDTKVSIRHSMSTGPSHLKLSKKKITVR